MPVSFRLDHVGLTVFELNGAEQTLQRLGFDLTPRGQHSAPLKPGGPVERLGSSNRCAMINEGYFEVAGLTDPDRPTWITELLSRYEGIHIIAIRVDDIEECRQDFEARGVVTTAPAVLKRDVESDGVKHTLEFRHMRTNFSEFEEARFVFVQHVTPELLWKPQWLSHRNGATSLLKVGLCTDSFVTTVTGLEHIFGVRPVLATDGVATFQLARGRIVVLDPDQRAARFPDAAPPRPRSAFTCRFGVAKLDATREVFHASNMPFAEARDGAIWVGPRETNGMVALFEGAR